MIILLTGPACSGKSTFEKMLEERGFKRIKSATSRVKRIGEKDDAYHWHTKDEFLRAVENDEFIEYTEYSGNYYGTPKSEIVELTVGVLEPNGCKAIKEAYKDSVVILYFDVDEEERHERSKKRGDSEAFWQKRLLVDRELFTQEFIDSCDWVLKDNSIEDYELIINQYLEKWILG